MKREAKCNHKPGHGRRVWRVALTASVLLAIVLLATACSSGSAGAGVAGQGASSTPTASGGLSRSSKQEALVAFSACMRENGVPNFPDPVMSGNGAKLLFGSESGIDTNAPAFENAMRTCQPLLPNGGESTPQEQAARLGEALDYASCMRAHGVSNFPDPKASGDGGIEWGELGPRVGIDPDSPQLRHGRRAC